MDNKTFYIAMISKLSTIYSDKLIEFLNEYKLTGLIDATEGQLAEFYMKQVQLSKKEKDI